MNDLEMCLILYYNLIHLLNKHNKSEEKKD